MRLAFGVVLLVAGLAACSDSAPSGGAPPAPTQTQPTPTRTQSAAPTSAPTTPADPPSTTPKPTRTPTSKPTAAGPVTMSIPAAGIRGLPVVAYRGTADDRPGTRIQDRSVAASPRGPAGGVGPGQIGNFIITGHRTSHGRPIGRVPGLVNGDHIVI